MPPIEHPSGSTPCLICGAHDASPLFVGTEDRFALGGAFPVTTCNGCGFTWTDLPSGFDLAAWYRRGYWRELRGPVAASHPSAARRRLRDAWRALHGSTQPSRWVRRGRVLDAGCGPGYDAREMSDLGAEVVGIDLHQHALQRSSASGLPVVRATPTAYPFADATFDVVVMSQLLEHLTDPLAALQSTRRVLRAGGTLLVLCPNAGGLQRRLFGARWSNWHLPYHLCHFDDRSATRLLERADFRVTRTTTISPGEWMVRSCSLRFPSLRPALRHRTLSRLLRLAAAPALRIVDLLGAGDCLVLFATRDK